MTIEREMRWLPLLFVVLFSSVLCESKNYVTVNCSQGAVQGRTVDLGNDPGQLYSGAAHVYSGIPYCQPPVGDRRFQPPTPINRFNATLHDATYFRPKCPQQNAGGPTNEDCLYLNVYTPMANNASANLSVLVLIDGGNGFSNGGCDESQVKGIVSNLVRRQIIVVTMQYRIGALGFFTTYTSAVQSNLGMLDQVQAMRWIKSEIVNFGGDPNKITVAGQDDGACAVSAHCISPMSQDLFNQAIVQSGSIYSCYNPLPAVPTNPNVEVTTPRPYYGNAGMETTTSSYNGANAMYDDPNQQLASTLCNISPQQWNDGVTGSVQDCLKNYTVDFFVNQQPGGPTATWMIVRDSSFLPDSIDNLNAKRPNIPIIIGTVQDEDADYAFKLINTGKGGDPNNLENWIFDFARKNKLNQTQTKQVSDIISQNYGVGLQRDQPSNSQNGNYQGAAVFGGQYQSGSDQQGNQQNNQNGQPQGSQNSQGSQQYSQTSYHNSQVIQQQGGSQQSQNNNYNGQGNQQYDQNRYGAQQGSQNSYQNTQGSQQYSQTTYHNSQIIQQRGGSQQNQNNNQNGQGNQQYNQNGYGQQQGSQNSQASQQYSQISQQQGGNQQSQNNNQYTQGNQNNYQNNQGNQQYSQTTYHNSQIIQQGNQNNNQGSQQSNQNAYQQQNQYQQGNQGLSPQRDQGSTISDFSQLRTITQIASDQSASLTTTQIQSFLQNGDRHVRIYQFTHVSDVGRNTVPNTGNNWKPVFKGQDMYFITMSETIWSNSPHTAADRQVADQMGQRWTDFVKTGQVNEWQPTDAQSYNYCDFNQTPTQKPSYAPQARRVFQDQVNPIVETAQNTYASQNNLAIPNPSAVTRTGQQRNPANVQYQTDGNGRQNFHITFQVNSFPFNG